MTDNLKTMFTSVCNCNYRDVTGYFETIFTSVCNYRDMNGYFK